MHVSMECLNVKVFFTTSVVIGYYLIFTMISVFQISYMFTLCLASFDESTSSYITFMENKF